MRSVAKEAAGGERENVVDSRRARFTRCSAGSNSSKVQMPKVSLLQPRSYSLIVEDKST